MNKKIVNENRECSNKKCKKIFFAVRNDKQYCSVKCAGVDWRNKKGKKEKISDTALNICGFDCMERNTPSLYRKYMENNPVYFEYVSGMEYNSNNVGIFLEGRSEWYG